MQLINTAQRRLFQLAQLNKRVSITSLKLQARKNGYYRLIEFVSIHQPSFLSAYALVQYKLELNTLVFEFTLSTRSQVWIIRRTLAQFVQLHKKLRPILEKDGVKLQVVEDNKKDTIQALQNFINQISSLPEVIKTDEWKLFVQISDVPSRWQGKKFREAYLRKKAGGRYSEPCCNCGILFGSQKRRYFVINSEGVYYYKDHTPASTKIKDMLAFNFQFALKLSYEIGGQPLGLRIVSSHRELEVSCGSVLEFIDLISTIRMAMNENSYLKANRYGSFAPIRKNTHCKYLVDGQNYFREVYKEITAAEKYVYITDWWLSPEFYLLRPASYFNEDHTGRIDDVLKKAAERGVHVYILIYWEPKIAINNDSIYTKTTLESLHSNIKVLRHPKYLVVPLLWSHHQKLVIIDQRVGFLGGLDICYGRMDSQKHMLTDTGPETFFPGVDYVNFRARDIYNPRLFYKESIDRQSQPRMPWHDVGVKLVGDSVTDLSRHFVQYWNFVNLQTTNNKEVMDMLNQDQGTVDPYSTYLEKLQEKIQLKAETKESFVSLKESRDYHKPEEHDDTLAGGFLEMPETASAKIQSIEGDFIDMLTHLRNEPEEEAALPPVLPAPDEGIRVRNNTLFKLPKLFDKVKSVFAQQPEEEVQNLAIQAGEGGEMGTCETQILRSASSWSVGLRSNFHEMSIHIAYIELIAKAREFIYIENQFFMSSTAGNPIKNRVAEALVIKIKKAAKAGQKFKVVVFLPLLPGFEGEIDQESSAVFRIQLYWEYMTISRGGSSIFEQLRDIPNASEYISFYGLRTHGLLNGKPHTEIIYIHTKLMIVDDEYVILGSANINDRSLLGERDSEIAIVVKDEQTVPAPRGMTWRKFAHDLRVELMSEHFGLPRSEVEDYLDPELIDKIMVRTVHNSEIYKSVFGCYPDCDAATFAEMYDARDRANPALYEEFKAMIKGHAVPFPLNFMRGEDLRFRPGSKENLVPKISFT